MYYTFYDYISSWLAQPWKSSRGYFGKLSTIIIQMETCNFHFQKKCLQRRRHHNLLTLLTLLTQSHICFIYCYMIKNKANDYEVFWELFGVSVLRWDTCVGHTPETVQQVQFFEHHTYDGNFPRSLEARQMSNWSSGGWLPKAQWNHRVLSDPGPH